MLDILPSQATTINSSFREVHRRAREDNVEWLARNLPGDVQQTAVVMVGGTEPCHFRLRVAQSHARHDLTPSHWSHVFVVGRSHKKIGGTRIWEIALDPISGFGFPPPSNGVQEARLGRYTDPKLFPNVAVFRLPVSLRDVRDAIDRFACQRAVLDAPEHILVWLAYLWGAGASPNPLLEDRGIPAAAMLETVLAAAGCELTPNLPSRSSCPEALWQTARWWHLYFEADSRKPLEGSWSVNNRLP